MPTIDYNLKNAPAEVWDKDHWTVLTFLLLHVNIRNRCWPGMRYIARMIGRSVPYTTEAKQWLVEHQAVRLVPVRERVAEERNLPRRQHVYEMTGRFIIDGVAYPYLYLTAEQDEYSPLIPPRETSTTLHISPYGSKTQGGKTKQVASGKPTPVSSSQDENSESGKPTTPLWNAFADAFYEGVRSGNSYVARVLFGIFRGPKTARKLVCAGVIDREAARQNLAAAELDFVALSEMVPTFRDTVLNGDVKEMRDPEKLILRWDGWRNSGGALPELPRLNYDPNCKVPGCYHGIVTLPDGRAGPCECQKRILAERKGKSK